VWRGNWRPFLGVRPVSDVFRRVITHKSTESSRVIRPTRTIRRDGCGGFSFVVAAVLELIELIAKAEVR
jgi:hypothetical protein